jgi:hypothetical protein
MININLVKRVDGRGDGIRCGINVRVEAHRVVWIKNRSHLIGPPRLVDVGHNLVVTTGLNLIRDLIIGVPDTFPITHIAVGTDGTPPVLANTALGAEVFRGPFTQKTSSVAGLALRYFLGPNDANGSTIRETGIFNAPIAGVMYARRLLTPQLKTAELAMTITWTLSWEAKP